ncbi:aminopeptidase N [Allobranchiibius sp. CTAmp26]|uniref:aminopeptidase N n=1 Tax=Allobranchiibius sp. CTAmp26 TaxID=2815214 RepID=UPI001AA13FC1|nr:aminopeptidase N [Allobranchiibius sp. CTAmp26]MBO1756000.1 aminopeptidase N [Allobranchiibius sp. CTAmp26]
MALQELTRDEAGARAELVEVHAHAVSLDLTTGPQTFGTTSRIEFSATPGAATFVDFLGESVRSIELNGAPLDPATHFDGARVTLPGLAAENVVRIEAVGRYMNTGEGVHRFVDPADGEVYLYTQFEVADSRRAFPVFEQPDLKTRFAFTVTAPATWQVLSNEPTPEPTTGENGSATWVFAPTPPISSYVTAFAAGPYDVVRDSVTTRAGEIPLGVLCRRSLREHLDADNILDLTKRGFAFFEEMFDREFPFTKYDQLFAPEYNMGAMENVGLVTIAEIYVFRSAVPESLVERRALTVLHELAHMWFGDLVTMRWWDDLWLNESFAEWASTTAQAEATRWDSAWTTFSLAEKSSAYIADQLSSTHPIAADARNWSDVENNFDHITYAKGASVLKQLVAYVGREPFVAGLRSYFQRYAWGNTDLSHLLAELEQTSGRDLTAWAQTWLQTAGVSTMRPSIETADGRLASVTIEQTAADSHPTLRPHRMGVGCYDLRDGRLERTSYVELDVDGPRTAVPELVGAPRPDLLLLNDEDLAYTKIRLDEASLATVLANPTALQDSLARSLVTAAVWDMTREAETAATDFIAFMLEVLAAEDDSTAMKVALEQISASRRVYVAPGHREAARHQVADGLGRLLRSAAAGSDAQLQFARAFAQVAVRPQDIATVQGLLDGSAPLAGLSIDTDMRWSLLTSLAASGAIGDDVIEKELASDRTSTGAERAAGARAAYPTTEAKEAAWAAAFVGSDLPNQTLVAVAAGFATAHDVSLLQPYVERFHAGVRTMWEGRTFAIASGVAKRMYPVTLADQGLLDATQAWLRDNGDAPDALRRIMSEHRDAVIRALRAQARDAQG